MPRTRPASLVGPRNPSVRKSANPEGLTTRFQYYKWEIEHGDYPIKAGADTNPDQCEIIADNKPKIDKCNDYPILKGQPDSTTYLADVNRRVITVPVLNCTQLGIGGKESDIWVPQEEYWKRFFITEHVDEPSGGPEIFAEYLGNAGLNDGTFHVEVKLYE